LLGANLCNFPAKFADLVANPTNLAAEPTNFGADISNFAVKRSEFSQYALLERTRSRQFFCVIFAHWGHRNTLTKIFNVTIFASCDS
jgi:hypothetical protein